MKQWTLINRTDSFDDFVFGKPVFLLFSYVVSKKQVFWQMCWYVPNCVGIDVRHRGSYIAYIYHVYVELSLI